LLQWLLRLLTCCRSLHPLIVIAVVATFHSGTIEVAVLVGESVVIAYPVAFPAFTTFVDDHCEDNDEGDNSEHDSSD